MPARPSHPTPNARDDRKAPLLVAAGCANINHEFPKNGRQLFCNRPLKRPILLKALANFTFRCAAIRSPELLSGCDCQDSVIASQEIMVRSYADMVAEHPSRIPSRIASLGSDMIYVTVHPVPRIGRPKAGLSKGFPASDAKKNSASRVQKVPPLIIIGNITPVEVNAASMWEQPVITLIGQPTVDVISSQCFVSEGNLARTAVGFKQTTVERLPRGNKITQCASKALQATLDRHRID